jgi:hypothetical protein
MLQLGATGIEEEEEEEEYYRKVRGGDFLFGVLLRMKVVSAKQ